MLYLKRYKLSLVAFFFSILFISNKDKKTLKSPIKNRQTQNIFEKTGFIQFFFYVCVI